ncbi:cupin domain-containing protein [Psychrobacter sp. Pi2-51]|uniref:cupin domain-containing protein n=1 Tax=Psychrobacter sp. Pi2-51 TaxID=2774132 RepID=UPI00191B3B37|nr:cupin domain-containing protein [Psychrobacter sp. Pi2-51]
MLSIKYSWQTTSQVGFERVILDRAGGEEASATSMVRHALESTFPYHAHQSRKTV